MITKPPFGAQIDHTHPQGNPSGLWILNEGSGSRAGDSGGNRNHGNIIGATWKGSPRGGVLSFNGSTDYVNCGNNSSLSLNRGTIIAWIKTSNAGSSFRGIALKPQAYGIFLVNNVLAIFDWGTFQTRSTGVHLADNVEHQVAVAFDSGVTNGTIIYIDSISVLTTTMTVNTQGDFLIGAGFPGGQNYAGLIEGGCVYPQILSASEIRQLFYNPYLMFPRPNISRYFIPEEVGFIPYIHFGNMTGGIGRR